MGGPRDPEGYSLGEAASARVAERVRDAMRAQKPTPMTQTELAKRMDIPQGHVSNLLSGRRRFQRWHVQRAAKALGLTEEDLIRGLQVSATARDQEQAAKRSDQRSTLHPRLERFIKERGSEFVKEELDFLHSDEFRWPGLETLDDDEITRLVKLHTSFLIRAAQRRSPRRNGGGERPGEH